MKHTFIREKSLYKKNCVYQIVDWFEYSEEEQQAAKHSRKQRQFATLPKNKSLNDKHSRDMFEWLVQNNFSKDDYSATLTFADEPTNKAGKRLLDNFIKRLRRLYRKKGLRLDYVAVTEGRASDNRLHYHLILNSGNRKIIRDEIEKLWHEGYCNVDRLQPNESGLTELCRYLEKSQKNAAKHKRAWTCSTHLKRPDIIIDDNAISRKRMRTIQNAARNDNIKSEVEKIYKNWTCLDSEIGVNEVTGRQFARFKLIKKPLPRKTKRKMERAAACSMPLRQNKINLRI